jgi:hypothetical protein
LEVTGRRPLAGALGEGASDGLTMLLESDDQPVKFTKPASFSLTEMRIERTIPPT